jgi:hypothetical protein
MLARNQGVKSWESVCLVHQLQHPRTMLDLIARVQICVESARVCHIFHTIFNQRWPKARKAHS